MLVPFFAVKIQENNILGGIFMSIRGATCESIAGSCGGGHYYNYAPSFNGWVHQEKEEYMDILYERAKEYNANRNLYDKLRFRKDFDLNNEDLEMFVKHDRGSIKNFFYTINDLKDNKDFIEVAEKQGWLEKGVGFISYKNVAKKINSYKHEKWLDKQRLELIDPPNLNMFKNLINTIEEKGKIDKITYEKIKDLIEDSKENRLNVYMSLREAEKTRAYHEILKMENNNYIEVITEDYEGRHRKSIELMDNDKYIFFDNYGDSLKFDTLEAALKHLFFDWCYKWEDLVSFEVSDKPLKKNNLIK